MYVDSTVSPSDAVSVYGVAVGDVTGDGLADVVASYNAKEPDSMITIFPQKGGKLGTPIHYDTLDDPQTLILADMNGDKRLDVVVVHTGWDDVGILLQKPGGGLATEVLFPFGTCLGNEPYMGVGDLNGDGKPDVAGLEDCRGLHLVLLLSQ